MNVKTKIKNIFIADISFEATEEDLHKLFSVCGTVRSIHMLTDPKMVNLKGVPLYGCRLMLKTEKPSIHSIQ